MLQIEYIPRALKWAAVLKWPYLRFVAEGPIRMLPCDTESGPSETGDTG